MERGVTGIRCLAFLQDKYTDRQSLGRTLQFCRLCNCLVYQILQQVCVHLAKFGMVINDGGVGAVAQDNAGGNCVSFPPGLIF